MNLALSKPNRYKFCFKTAKIFFLFGSLLFLIQLVLQEFSFVTIIGLYYVGLAVIINLIILLGLVLALIFESSRIETLKSIGILATNIPIAYVYKLIVINFLV